MNNRRIKITIKWQQIYADRPRLIAKKKKRKIKLLQRKKHRLKNALEKGTARQSFFATATPVLGEDSKTKGVRELKKNIQFWASKKSSKTNKHHRGATIRCPEV